MIEDIKKDSKQRMEKSVEALGLELTKIRTGRAHPSLLDQVSVVYYEVPTPLNQVASVTVADARTLLVTPWEKSMVKTVEKAIGSANLGLNPATSGDSVRVPLPPLTEERRKDLSRVVRQEVENGRVSVRNIRRDAISTIKALLKAKDISEDEERKGEEAIQKLTDTYIEKMDEMLKAKEEELMEV